eukprot:2550601-Amphidinium_carterae.1
MATWHGLALRHTTAHLAVCRLAEARAKARIRGKGKPKGHAAHVTDAAVPEEPAAEEVPAPEIDETAEEWPMLGAVAEAAEALSVTAQKLRHITQSRGWYQPGKDGKDKGKGKSKDKDKKGGKPSVDTSLPPPSTTRWDSITASGSAGSRQSPPRPPPADPKR